MSLPDEVIVSGFNASGGVLLRGEIVRATTTNRDVVRAQADAAANLSGTLGPVGSFRAADGNVVNIVAAGRGAVRLATDSPVPAAGNTLWISATEAGRATVTEPLNGLAIGIVTDASGFNATTNPVVIAIIHTPTLGAGGGAAETFLVFDNVAALQAFAVGPVVEGTNAFVRSLYDEFILEKTSTATADTKNFTVVAANTGVAAGRWLRKGLANERWGNRLDVAAGNRFQWYIDSVNGDNENVGTLAAPLQTAAELDRRLHGLKVPAPANFEIHILENLDDDDPILVRFTPYTIDQLAQLRIVGTRTVAASGTVSSVTNQDAATNQASEATLSVDIDAHVGKYVRFLNGAAFRCSAWIAKAVTPGSVYRLSTPGNGQSFTSFTAVVNPQAGDNFEVYDLVTVPDIIFTIPHIPNGVQAADIKITNVGGGNFALYGQIRNTFGAIFNCDLDAQTYFGKSDFHLDNCRSTAPLAPVTGHWIFIAGLHVPHGATKRWFWLARLGQKAAVAFNFSPLFQDGHLTLNNVESDLATNSLQFFDCTEDCLRLGRETTIDIAALWGGSNALDGIDFTGTFCRVRLSATPTLAVSGDEVSFPGGAKALFADLAANNLPDERGNEIIGLGGRTVASAIEATNTSGGTITAGEVVRTTTAAGAFAQAQADSAANAGGVMGVLLNNTLDDGVGLIAQAGAPRALYDGAPTAGGLAYLSPGTAGRLTTTVPAAVASNQKLRAGRVGAVTGTAARTAWHPENLPVAADGSP